MKREPGGNCRCDNDEESEGSEAAMKFFEAGDSGLAGLLALLVLVGRRRREVRHRVIIAYRLGALGLRLEIEVAKKERQGGVRSELMLPCLTEDVMVRRGTSVRIEADALLVRC